MSKPTRLEFKTLATCLTIFQFATLTTVLGSGASAEAQTKTTQVAQNETASSTDASTSVSDGSTVMSTPRTRISTRLNHSPIFYVPQARTFAVEATGGGSSASTSGKNTTLGQSTSVTKSTQTYSGVLNFKYGLSDMFHLYGTFGYGSSEVKTENQGIKLNYKSIGMSEPTVGASVHGVVGNTLLIADLSQSIPMGNNKATRSSLGDTTESDGLTGGTSTIPSVAVLSDLGPVRLIGGASYEIKTSRKTDLETTSSTFGGYKTTTTSETSGGNSAVLATAIEFPRALNLGIMGMIERREDSTVKSPAAQTITNSGSTVAYGVLYGAIPIVEKARIVPKLTYVNMIETATSSDLTSSLKYDRGDAWGLTLSTQILF